MAFTAEELALAEVRRTQASAAAAAAGVQKPHVARARARAREPAARSRAQLRPRGASPAQQAEGLSRERTRAAPRPLPFGRAAGCQASVLLPLPTHAYDAAQPQKETAMEAWYMDDSDADQRLPHRCPLSGA
jgi:hypothetical protein